MPSFLLPCLSPQSTYDYGRQLLQATVVLCQSLRCTTRSSGDTLPRLNRVWKQFTVSTEERQQRLELALSFHSAAEKVTQRERPYCAVIISLLVTSSSSLCGWAD